MTTIGFIGSGKIGSTVARLAVEAGHEVVLSNSRGPETLADLVAELGTSGAGCDSPGGGGAGELVVVTIPLQGVPRRARGPARGKTVLDTINYYPQRDSHVAQLDDGRPSAANCCRHNCPGPSWSRCSTTSTSRTWPASAAGRRPGALGAGLAGDDEAAKAAVAGFLDSIGYDAHDAGPLAEGWRFQAGTPAYGAPYAPEGMGGPGHPLPDARLAELLAAATRES